MTHHDKKSEETESTVDHEMIAMVVTGAILVGGFFIIGFVSGPLGLFLSLLALTLTGIYYAIVASK